ncbi:MAG: hypothetical protein HOC77_09900 [Chloroflexi bacterium]|nr:hypothetical protein [Chloroflexota bacterium]MBT4074708.1 hypothetical protein [Chloroflexota bacterium]MBT4515388.1 hypothetical protein [Chloroflexota bacterium]MBT5319743.1 hypothetical protein [Chloroflexota bacterium]MBT6682099.1 hypothetical protein [Chloroflexota bacterium]
MTSDSQHGSQLRSELLRAGYAETVITPPVGFEIEGPEHATRRATDVTDDLLGRVLVLEAGGDRAAIVTLDVWGVSERFTARVVESVSSAAGVDESLVWIGVSGNATSPPLWDDGNAAYVQYAAYVPQQIGGIAALAAGRLQDAELGFATASLPDLATSVNGRYEDLNEIVPMMIVDGVSGPIARVFGFSCPGSVIGGHSTDWTADYPGYACWALSEASGAEGCMFIRGPSSDVRPFDWSSDNPAPTHTDRGAADVQALGWLLATQAGVATQGALLRRNIDIAAVVRAEPDSGLGIVKGLKIGDGVFESFTASLTSEFGTTLAEASPDQTVFVCANLGGASFGAT